MRSLYVLAILLPLLAGCGGGPYNVAPVSGRVTVNGQALANAAITFQPYGEGKTNPGPGSGGFTDSDGRYTLKLVGTDTRGAVVGKHLVKISLTHPDDSADDRPKRIKQPPAKFNTKKKLEYDVPACGTDAADFQLTAP
jgi:hypothetical protein